MPTASNEIEVDDSMYKSFINENVKSRHAIRWCQLSQYLGLNTYSVDPEMYDNEDLIVISSIRSAKYSESILMDMHNADKRVVLIVNGINKNKESREWWAKVTDEVILDFNYFGVIVFDKHLNTKKYKLKF